jgi:hypothetical protein
MPFLSVGAAQAGFLDRKVVIDAVGKAKAKYFNEAGRLVRKTALKSLVYSDKASSPGQPPHAHKSRKFTRRSRRTGKSRTRNVSFLREFLYYKYDKSTKSVVVGPERLRTTVDAGSLKALEQGGNSTIVDRGKKRRVRIKARPFMGPALAAEAPNLPAIWRDSVR